MNLEEKQYLDILAELLDDGVEKKDRTGTGTKTLFVRQMRFDLSKSFPLLTSKKMFMKGIVAELLWFLSGSQNERDLCELTYGTRDLSKKTIWSDNCADRAKTSKNRFNGYNMGNMYNVAWRNLPCTPHGHQYIDRKVFVENEEISNEAQNIKLNTLTEKKLHKLWLTLMEYEYNKLCNRWKLFNNFVHDCFFLKGFQEYIDSNYTNVLDCAFYGSGVYSPETAIFITPQLKDKIEKGFTVYEYNGETYYSLDSLYTDAMTTNVQPDKVLTSTKDKLLRPIIFIDQIERALALAKNDPDSRRNIIDAWNVRNTDNAALGVCHPFVQIQILDGKLNLVFTMRSADTFLGTPYNIASYAILAMLLAHHTGYEVGELVYVANDIHLYNNHVDQAKEQISRTTFDFPKLEINWKDSLYDYTVDDFKLVDYQSHGTIKAPMAV